jgi:hypothetical protein
MRAKLTPAFIEKAVPPADGRVIFWTPRLRSDGDGQRT